MVVFLWMNAPVRHVQPTSRGVRKLSSRACHIDQISSVLQRRYSSASLSFNELGGDGHNVPGLKTVLSGEPAPASTFDSAFWRSGVREQTNGSYPGDSPSRCCARIGSGRRVYGNSQRAALRDRDAP